MTHLMKQYMVNLWWTDGKKYLKAPSVILNSKLPFFSQTPRFFCKFREKFSVIDYLSNNSHGMETGCFGNRDNSLLLVLLVNYLNFKVLVHFSMWHSDAYFFKQLYWNSSGFMCFISFYWKIKQENGILMSG